VASRQGLFVEQGSAPTGRARFAVLRGGVGRPRSFAARKRFRAPWIRPVILPFWEFPPNVALKLAGAPVGRVAPVTGMVGRTGSRLRGPAA